MGKETFGTYLRKLRLTKGFGLRSFAKQAGLLPSNLSAMESGRANPPRHPDVLKRIAKGLGLSEEKPEWAKLFDLATKPGQVPADVQEYFSEIDAMDELPLMARTIKNQKLSKPQIQRLIRDLKHL